MIREGERPDRSVDAWWEPGRVLVRLDFNPSERRSFGLRFNGPYGTAIHIEEIVCSPVAWLEREPPDGDPARCAEVDAPEVLHFPAAKGQDFVDSLAGELFRQPGHKPEENPEVLGAKVRG